MNDGDFLVDILDRDGQVVGSKLRKEIVKGEDIYHAVYCVVITPEHKFVINLIADRQDMPNLHAGKYGCTAATIRRTNETSQEAADRAVKNELHIDAKPSLLHEELIEIDNTHRLVGWYTVKSETPKDFNKEDIEDLIVLGKDDFLNILKENPEKITSPLKKFWGIFSS